MTMNAPEQLPLIGRERALADTLATSIYKAVYHPKTKLVDRRRGVSFEVQYTLRDSTTKWVDEPTGHIFRVEITLDRLDPELASS